MNKFKSQTEASIIFFGESISKIEDVYICLDLDDLDIKSFIKETVSNNITTQKIFIPIFDIHHKDFSSSIGDDGIITNECKLCKPPEYATIFKSIFCKASHPDNHPTIWFIVYSIQRIINKYFYGTILEKRIYLRQFHHIYLQYRRKKH